MNITKQDAAALLADLDFGSSVAEHDTLLESARVETSVFDDLLADRVDLIPGTKGSGKTALYRMFVEFLPDFMLKERKVVIAHGIKQRQDTIFLAYKKQFDSLSESDFVDFWCVYFISLAYEQFIKNPKFKHLLQPHQKLVEEFRRAYERAGIPDFEKSKSLKEIIAWALAVVKKFKPRVTWKLPEEAGQLEFTLDYQESRSGHSKSVDDDPRMPAEITSLANSLASLVREANLRLWLMVDRLDELFARRSETEKRALRGLLRTLPLFHSDEIRIKAFLRDDIFDHIVKGEGFTALTHVTSRMSDTLRWAEDQILTMIVTRICANENIAEFLRTTPDLLKTSPEYRKQTFYKVFGDFVYRPPNQSTTLSWIYNHTRDGRGVVTPRDVIDLLTRASQKQRDEFRKDPTGSTDRLLLGHAIVYGLDELSKAKRTNYLEAEFPHKWQDIRKLVGGGTEYGAKAVRRVFGKKVDETLEDLIAIGVLSKKSRRGETTYQVPFLYRRGLECTQRYIGE